MSQSLISEKERLIRAIRWISDYNRHDPAGIQEAAMRYDLSPTDEEFLLEHFTVRAKPRYCPTRLLGLIKVPGEGCGGSGNSFQHFFYIKWWLLIPIILLLIVFWYFFLQQPEQCTLLDPVQQHQGQQQFLTSQDDERHIG
jgi:hypothetical protein